MTRLVMLSGLPGSGKSTLARRLSEQTGAKLLRIDVFEQDLRNLRGAGFDVGTLGYEQGYTLAARHLGHEQDVIADAVNAVEAAREGWRAVARAARADLVEIEITCSDTEELVRRLGTRDPGIPGLAPVRIEAVAARPWEANPNRLARIDTAGRGIDDCAGELLRLSGLP
ncbi:MAG: AAA family ATPase [Hyphomonas sp.]|nr:AAA family ATPase [Hyphomonas sp.]